MALHTLFILNKSLAVIITIRAKNQIRQDEAVWVPGAPGDSVVHKLSVKEQIINILGFAGHVWSLLRIILFFILQPFKNIKITFSCGPYRNRPVLAHRPRHHLQDDMSQKTMITIISKLVKISVWQMWLLHTLYTQSCLICRHIRLNRMKLPVLEINKVSVGNLVGFDRTEQ